MHPHAAELAMFRRPDTAKPLARVRPIVWAQVVSIGSISLALIILAIKGY